MVVWEIPGSNPGQGPIMLDPWLNGKRHMRQKTQQVLSNKLKLHKLKNELDW